MSLTWTLGSHLLRLFRGSEENRLAGGAAASHTDALNVNDVFCVLIQIPQCTGARGGIHFLDKPQHVHVLLLQSSRKAEASSPSDMTIYMTLLF